MRTGKLIKFSENQLRYPEPLVEIKIQKGEKTKISWRCLSALIEAKISIEHARLLLNEENLKVKKDAFEDSGFDEGNLKNVS